MKIVFIDDLPRYIDGRYKGKIDWKNSVGYNVKFIYEEITGEVIINGYPSTNVIEVKYNDLILNMNTAHFSNAKLGMLVKHSRNFKYNIGDLIEDDRRKLLIIEQSNEFYSKSIRKCYKYKCLKCGYESDLTSEYNLSNGYGCPVCVGQKVLVGFNDVTTTAPHLIPFIGESVSKMYTKHSNKTIEAKCPDCNKVKRMSLNTLYSYGIQCSCGDGKSYPEKFMASVLNQLGVEYVWGFRPDWLRGYKGSNNKAEFDFYIEKYSIVIEVDGGMGHGKFTYQNNLLSSIESKLKDDWKDSQAKINGIFVIRINADESEPNYLKTNIIKAISNIISLKNIDWDNCDIFATKNIAKEVCLFFEDNKPISTYDLGSKFNLCRDTISKYLKIGNKFGWCDYNGKLNSAKVNKIKQSNIPIDVYKNNIYLGTYISAMELSRCSEKDFGVKLWNSNISKVIAGELKQQKGYTFKYTNTN